MASLAEPPAQLWVLLCTVLVLLMQMGFLLLEAGAVQAKNTANVAFKNLSDLCLAVVVFWAVGHAVMFGGAPFDTGADAAAQVFFLFQAAFCGTAATIVSGAVAERMSLRGYLLTTLLCAGVIYPVIGGWAWGSAGGLRAPGWLEARGFVDFAGSTVVHSTGGWVALAAILVLGPRRRRFGPEQRRFEGSNLALSTGGVMLLWIGWLGFNGGSLLAFDARVVPVLLNTILAGAAGGLAAMLGMALVRVPLEVLAFGNGVVGGLVAITAGAHLAGPGDAILIGVGGGLMALLGIRLIEALWIDDVVGAVPAHLFAGVFGTLATAMLDGEGWLPRLGVQALGVAATGAWAFGVTYAVLRLTHRAVRLRVSVGDETAGLNLVEHGAGSAMQELLDAMECQQASGDFSTRVPVVRGEDAGVIAARYNGVLDRVSREIAAREAMADSLAVARDAAEAASRAKSAFLSTVSHELRTPMNGVLGLAAVLDATPLDARQKALVGTLRRSGEALVGVLGDVLDVAQEASGPAALDPRPVSPALVAARIEARHGPAARAKGLAFRVEGGADLDDERLIDPDALGRIADHLAGNAVKFTASGAVTVSLAADATGLRLTVRDTGPGLPDGVRARMFEPFVQADSSATRVHGGMGLGLAVVARLVQAMGGRIGVDSRPGSGTAITVVLPCRLAVPRDVSTA